MSRFLDGAPVLGEFADLPALLERHGIDILIAARLDLPRSELTRLVALCEHAYVVLKIIPSVFQIFVSGLRLQTVGRVPVLGVDELVINKLFNRALKRGIDLFGAAVGLAISAPILAVLAAIPTPISGTPVGLGLLAWTGLGKLLGKGPPK